jgi:hypothetical protein
MASITIPARYREGLFKISKMGEQDVKEIRAALDSIADTSAPPIIAAQGAVESIKQRNAKDFQQIAEALGSLYSARATRDASTEEFVNEICDAMLTLDSEKFRLPEREREQFRLKLITLLAADFFGIVSKAWDLKTDDEHVFCNVRILTDLRPVFGSSVDEGPKAMVVVHQMRLGYDPSGHIEKHEDFYLTLDADDIRTLRKALDRAETKARSLGAMIKNVRILGLSKE